jgi:hypothetical protein
MLTKSRLSFWAAEDFVMADKPVVHIGENSPEYVAYKLMLDIIRIEGKERHSKDDILNLYAECLHTVNLPHLRAGRDKTIPR